MKFHKVNIVLGDLVEVAISHFDLDRPDVVS
jgi:translation initiation factor IF-1